jgi:threonine dehydrogenase-like Zn-dependent dehydrogenase
MRALVFDGPWDVRVVDCPVPELREPTDCLVRVVACGICGTDLGIVRGSYGACRPPVVLGHEATGVVVRTGPGVAGLREGDRVAINPTYFCGVCRFCRSGRPNHCARKDGTEAGVSSNGTLAEYYVTGERFLHRIPPELGYVEGALTEPLSCVLTGVRQIVAHPATTCLVLGLGPVGLLYALALGIRGVRGVAVEPAAHRRALAEKLLFPRWSVTATLEDAVAADGGGQIDLLVDTSGTFDGSLLPHIAAGGQVLLVALRPHREQLDLGDLADRSISLIGSIDSLGTFDDALHLLADGVVPAQSLVTHVVPLESVPSALRLLGCDLATKTYTPDAAALKVVVQVTPEESAHDHERAEPR